MSYEPLHHKYRPQTFQDLVGQEAIANTLINAIELQKIAPAYLFTGPRGTGKTSSARILAKSLNCLAHGKPTANPCGQCEVCLAIATGNALDTIEIDAASNTGVDNIRELIERSRFAPVQSRYKVYAIDECHMLSTAAFNALLKTLEEPPPQVVFILATTDPQRVLSTIISRCQRFDYRRIPLEAMVKHLQYIAEQENIAITTEALTLNAQIANGGLRDAESLLDQLSLFPEKITVDKIWDLVGAVPERDLLALLIAIREQKIENILAQCRNLLDRGREPLVLLQNLAGFYLNLLIAKTSPKRQDLVAVTETCWQQLCTEAQYWQIDTILQGQQHLKDGEVQIKHTTQPRLWLEVTLLGLLSKAVAPESNINRSNTVTEQKPALTVTQHTTHNNQKENQLRENTVSVKETNTVRDDSPLNSSATSTNNATRHNEARSLTPQATPTDLEQQPLARASGQKQPVEQETKSQSLSTAIPQETKTSENINTEDSAAIWQQVIDCIHPPMTQALLRQQCHLITLTDSAAVVGISSAPLQKMNQGRVPNIEAAFAKVCQRTIKVKLEVAGLPDGGKKNSNLDKNNTPQRSYVPQNSPPNPDRTSQAQNTSVVQQSYSIPPLERTDLPINSQSRLQRGTTRTAQEAGASRAQICDSQHTQPSITPTPTAISKQEEIKKNSVSPKEETTTKNDIQTKIESNSTEITSTKDLCDDPDDFAKAVELVAQKFDGEVIELQDSFSSEITSATELVAAEELELSPRSSETSEEEIKPSIAKIQATTPRKQKVVIKRNAIADYDNDDDVPFVRPVYSRTSTIGQELCDSWELEVNRYWDGVKQFDRTNCLTELL